MSQLDDLSQLFQRFGGKPETYKEIVREDAAAQARERWPLLSAVRVDGAGLVPPVHATGQPAAAPVAPVASPAMAAAVRPMANHVEAPAMAPRFRTPEGMPPAPQALAQAVPAVPPASGPASGSAPGHASGLTPAAEPAASSCPAAIWTPTPEPAEPERPSPIQPAQPVAAGTELSRVFARLEGRPQPAPASERVPARRSFLDRLNRS
ncbi:hypothetical protein JJQ59_25300 [Cupriavidus necator]|uniref:Cellulose biosynthesis protein BcsR n=1 Tax=Cupriavidus necator TaxID=106590 RepID=A0A367PSG0_CUPNE|nr:cellulose biosynthesis protein BcsP [Cupriavidus necator]QQX88660.1 hypothetical protein JJQ59_25300 [Cupriavidus necator]RCJ09845.1 hypothetical protein DDK22_04315 [Cupriavidus necator]